ncbi:hypothetical protein PQX77_011497 [Marasmius sp. AFHP31]|nr:hypothetical protein PQX77_011497 [Marasmius sp. AFHP31]
MRLDYLENIVLRGAGHPQVYQTQQPGYAPSVQSGPGSSHPQHPPQSLQPPPTQSLPPHHSSIPGVAGPPPVQPPPSLGIHHLLSGAPPSPTRSPNLAGSRTQRDLERDRDLRHVRSSPVVGFSSRDRKVPSDSLSNIPPPPLPGMSTEPRRMGHQHSLSSSSVGSAYGQEGSGKSPSSSTATVKGGRRRSRSPR